MTSFGSVYPDSLDNYGLRWLVIRLQLPEGTELALTTKNPEAGGLHLSPTRLAVGSDLDDGVPARLTL